MNDVADLNFVLAVILPEDPLKARAERRLSEHARLTIPFSVGVELLMVAKRFDLGCVAALGAASGRFDVEEQQVLATAAEALDSGEIGTVFDAVHCAEAYHRGVRLHTADDELLRSAFPTRKF